MSEDSQIVVPEAFVDLFRPLGADRSRRPLETREVIAEADVLERIQSGLLEAASPVSAREAGWVVGRLAEVLGWPFSASTQPSA
jgi:hypothetical protein